LTAPQVTAGLSLAVFPITPILLQTSGFDPAQNVFDCGSLMWPWLEPNEAIKPRDGLHLSPPEQVFP